METQIARNQISIIIQEVLLDFLKVIFDTSYDASHATLAREPIKYVDVAVVILIQAGLAEVIQEVDLASDTVYQQVKVTLQ